ncbi:MAG: hypothetical protein AAFY71_07980 [Bacteroidota bacterium]
MAKKFLDALADAFEDDVLTEVIPLQERPARQTPNRRKKRFVESLDETLGQKTSTRKPKGKGNRKRRKSLLDTMEEALDNDVFDQIFPEAKNRPTKRGKTFEHEPESPFSTMITTKVLDRAREIALQKGIRVKDVINMALSLYVDKELDDNADL